ncbi:MAG TPA: RimK family alpha-L-glutamate ligase [Anaeromyxobacteraceae bacterium]
MRVTVLSRSQSIYGTRRLAEAARGRGHVVRVVDPLQVEMGLGAGRPALFHRGEPFPRTDVALPRIAVSIHQYGLAVVTQLQQLGVPLLNGAAGIGASRDKMRCLQLLASSGVAVPRTVMAGDPSGLREMVKHVGGVPVLVKLVGANERGGVMICETLQSLEAALEAILGLGQNIVVQQYVREAKGRDLRALVVGGRVVAALRRRPPVGRMARSLGRGARFEAAALAPACHRAAVAAARVVDLEVCAVDMLDVRGGPLVFEVNGSPGLRELEEACGVDAADAILARAEEIAGVRRPAARAAAR